MIFCKKCLCIILFLLAQLSHGLFIHHYVIFINFSILSIKYSFSSDLLSAIFNLHFYVNYFAINFQKTTLIRMFKFACLLIMSTYLRMHELWFYLFQIKKDKEYQNIIYKKKYWKARHKLKSFYYDNNPSMQGLLQHLQLFANKALDFGSLIFSMLSFIFISFWVIFLWSSLSFIIFPRLH